MTQESNKQKTDIQTRNQNSSPPPGTQDGGHGGRGLNPVLLRNQNSKITTDLDSSPPGKPSEPDGTDRAINAIK